MAGPSTPDQPRCGRPRNTRVRDSGGPGARRGSRVLSGRRGPDWSGVPKTSAAESYAHAPGKAETASEERDGEPGNECEATHAGRAKPTARLDTYRTPRTPGSQQPTRLRSLAGLRNSRPSPEGPTAHEPGRGGRPTPRRAVIGLNSFSRASLLVPGARRCAQAREPGPAGPELFPQQPGRIPSGECTRRSPLPDLGDRRRPPRPSCRPRLDARGEEVRTAAWQAGGLRRGLGPASSPSGAPRGVRNGGAGPAGPVGRSSFAVCGSEHSS